MRVLVTGSRYWTDVTTIEKELTGLPIETTIVHGGAKGADTIADVIATEMGFKVEVFPANWEQYGRAAGPIRNREMLLTNPDLVLAFLKPASKGTKDCIKQAKARKIKVKVIDG